MSLSIGLVKQPEQREALFVVDRGHHIGVADVVDPWHVLVADPFDAMPSETELVERGALQCFRCDDAHVRVDRAEIIARRDRAGRTRRRDETSKTIVGASYLFKNGLDGVAGDVVMPYCISKLLKLVEDHAIGPGATNLPALVVDLLYIGFTARVLESLRRRFP